MKRLFITILGLYISIFPVNFCIGETFDNSHSPLIITEILPNPKGADKGQEWVEIYNTTEQRISLSNWKLSNGKIFNIPEGLSVLPKSYFVLQDSNLKITLKNSNTSLSLIDHSDSIVQEISYQKSKEGQSYSLINLKTPSGNKNYWDWALPTKGSNNQTLYLLKGSISKSPTIDKEFYFEIFIADKNFPIIFYEDSFNFDLLVQALIENSEGIFLVEKSNNKLILKNFKITKNPQTSSLSTQIPNQKTPPSQTQYWLLIPIITLTALLIYLSRTRTSSLPS